MVFNKLVRDRIPEIIAAHGSVPHTRILEEGEYRTALEAKLDEEAAEYHRDKTPEELADILEVVFALAAAHGCAEEELLQDIMENLNLFHEKLKLLTEVTEQANLLKGDSKSQAVFCRDYVFQTMKELREPADRLEMLVDEDVWPFPTYGELLYNI